MFSCEICEIFAKHLLYRTRLGDCFCILILCLEIPFSENSCHIETSQAISKANKLTGFYMIQVFTKRYSQTDCSIFLKILYLAPGSSKEFCTNMGFFVQSQIYRLQRSVILFKCVTFFAVFHSPHKALIPETILTRRLITKAKIIGSQITVC